MPHSSITVDKSFPSALSQQVTISVFLGNGENSKILSTLHRPGGWEDESSECGFLPCGPEFSSLLCFCSCS